MAHESKPKKKKSGTAVNFFGEIIKKMRGLFDELQKKKKNKDSNSVCFYKFSFI